MYSDSHEDMATVCWRFEPQETGDFPIVTRCPLTDRRVALSDAQSASDQTDTGIGPSDLGCLMTNLTDREWYRYLRTRFRAPKRV